MRRIDISPFEIQIFLEVAATGNFSRTAETTALSQPAVSRAINRLEQRLNMRLFDRTTRQVALTPFGEAFLPIAKRVVHDLTVSLDEVTSYVEGGSTHVSIAALPSAAARILPDPLRRFHRDHPAVTIDIIDGFKGSIAESVTRAEADFGISVEAEAAPHLGFSPLARDRFFAVLHRGHELAAREVLTWAELFQSPVIAMRAMTSVRQLTDQLLRDLEQAGSYAHEATHPATAGAMIEAGLGVTALPELTLELLPKGNLVFAPLVEPALYRDLGILFRRGRTLHPLAVRLMDYIAEDQAEKRRARQAQGDRAAP